MTGLWYHEGEGGRQWRNKEAFILFLSFIFIPPTISRQSLDHTQWTSDEKRIHFTSLQSSLSLWLFPPSLSPPSISHVNDHLTSTSTRETFDFLLLGSENSTWKEETLRKEFNGRQGMTENLKVLLDDCCHFLWRRRARSAWRQNLICFC